MSLKNAIYAQSGGVTAVINAQALGVIHGVSENPHKIGKLLVAKDGIIGVLKEELIDISSEAEQNIENLFNTPGGAFGSCRHKLTKDSEFQRLVEVFKAHNIGYFFYNGGGDSQDTASKIAQLTKDSDFPITCIGIPKTIDNDLPYTDYSPGFGSVAKYIAVSTLEASLDVASMASSSTKVFILEVMGRHAGWIVASSGLCRKDKSDPPHIILFPEITFNEKAFLQEVENSVNNYGYCVVVASEGVKDENNKFLSEAGLKDAFGHAQLGGVAPKLAQIIKEKLNYKYHFAIADYLQRAARHIASKIDVDHAYLLGKEAVSLAMQGKNAVMPIIVRETINNAMPNWSFSHVDLDKVANVERKMPKNYITANGFGITSECYNYLLPLIQGEAYPPYVAGLPKYTKIKNNLITKKLNSFIID